MFRRMPASDAEKEGTRELLFILPLFETAISEELT